jgi:hypothetical protein
MIKVASQICSHHFFESVLRKLLGKDKVRFRLHTLKNNNGENEMIKELRKEIVSYFIKVEKNF